MASRINASQIDLDSLRKEIGEGITINNCEFVGVKWNAEIVQTAQTVAEALLENSKALARMTQLFRELGVVIPSMISAEGSTQLTVRGNVIKKSAQNGK